MSTLALARGVRELLSDPARWCKGTAARDAAGEPIGFNHMAATQWCLVGAAYKLSGSDNAVTTLIDAFAPLGDKSIGHANDNATHEELLALLDRTIAKLEAVEVTL